MKILVTGSRRGFNNEKVRCVLDEYKSEITTLIHGGAPGVDSIANYWAHGRYVPTWRFPANWVAHGRGAGPRRNQQMLDIGQPDLVIGFPLLGSIGTFDMLKRAEKAGVNTRIIRDLYHGMEDSGIIINK